MARGRNVGLGGEWLYGSAVIMGDYSAALRAIADATGGRVFDLSQTDAFLEPLRQAVDEFRTTYVLRYRPRVELPPDVATQHDGFVDSLTLTVCKGVVHGITPLTNSTIAP